MDIKIPAFDKINQSKIAFCIPTYQRSLVVDELLEECVDFLNFMGIDIYFYDSSEDENTKLCVDHWMEKYKNIFYTHLPTDWHANAKVLYIFEQYSLEQKYDYLWLCGDSIRFSNRVVGQVIDILSVEYDLLIVNGQDFAEIGSREYVDKNELFLDCAWYMTLFGGVVLNIHTLLKAIPWITIREKYEIPSRINFSHIGVYLETIHNMENFKAFHLSCEKGLKSSSLKGFSGWYQDAFKILCEYWPSTIEALPPYYTRKVEAMNKLGYYSCLRSFNLLYYRRKDVYNIYTLLKYWKVLGGLTNLNAFQLWSMACLEPNLAYFILEKNLKGYFDAILNLHALHKFCKKYESVYIYGAGIMGKRYQNYLKHKGINIAGFVVTERGNNSETVNGYPVTILSKMVHASTRIGIIVAVNPKYIQEVEAHLKKYNMWDNTYYEYINPIMMEQYE